MLGAMTSLVPCTACARHVRATESACPFCGAAIALVAPREPAPEPADRLLARAAIAFATATMVAACGKTDAPPPPPPAPPAPTPTMNAAPAYGVPPMAMPDAAAPEAPKAPEKK